MSKNDINIISALGSNQSLTNFKVSKTVDEANSPLRSLNSILDANLEIPKAAIHLEGQIEMAND